MYFICWSSSNPCVITINQKEIVIVYEFEYNESNFSSKVTSICNIFNDRVVHKRSLQNFCNEFLETLTFSETCYEKGQTRIENQSQRNITTHLLQVYLIFPLYGPLVIHISHNLIIVKLDFITKEVGYDVDEKLTTCKLYQNDIKLLPTFMPRFEKNLQSKKCLLRIWKKATL